MTNTCRLEPASPVMTDRRLTLLLSSGETLPMNLSWQVEDGYLVMSTWGEDGDSIILGLWGPGDVVIPSLIDFEPLQLCSLSSVHVQEWNPSEQERLQFLRDQVRQLASLQRLTRILPAATRLFRLLLWLDERCGRVSSRGVSLSFEAMQLTHRQLAHIFGLTGVTVIRSLTQFRQEGRLSRQGRDELLLPHS